ncbi:MAG: NAD-dependent epimerase/dehydratase family protein, partial [Bacilli bacterium]
ACEYYLDFFSKQYGFQWSILRYANVFGPRQNAHGESGVISIFANRIRNGLPPIVYGSGTQIRDYVYVSDVVAANVLFSRFDTPNEIYNVGTGIGTSLNRLLQLITSQYPNVKTTVYEKAKSGDIQWNVLAVDKLKSFGWQPKVNIEQGLKEVCTIKGE